MTRAEFLLRCLRDQGLGHVFLVSGGHIDPLVAELGKGAGLRPIVAAREEGAGFMADGYARISSRFGVCMCIGGPGAGNPPGNSRTGPLTLLSPPSWGESRMRGQRLGACGSPHKLLGTEMKIFMRDTLYAPDRRKVSWRDATAARPGERRHRGRLGLRRGGGAAAVGRSRLRSAPHQADRPHHPGGAHQRACDQEVTVIGGTRRTTCRVIRTSKGSHLRTRAFEIGREDPARLPRHLRAQRNSANLLRSHRHPRTTGRALRAPALSTEARRTRRPAR
jgi:hypothetical protein